MLNIIPAVLHALAKGSFGSVPSATLTYNSKHFTAFSISPFLKGIKITEREKEKQTERERLRERENEL